VTTERSKAVESQPHNLLLEDEDEDRPMIYQCKFCGAPSARDPSDQDMPVDYCWQGDHQ